VTVNVRRGCRRELERDANLVGAAVEIGSSVKAEELAARLTQAPVLADRIGVAPTNARLKMANRLFEAVELETNEVTAAFLNFRHPLRQGRRDVGVGR